MRKPSHRTFALASEHHRRLLPPEVLASGKARVRCARCRRQLWFSDVAIDGRYCTILCAEPKRGAAIVRARLIYDDWREFAYCRCRSGRGATKRNYYSPQAAGRAAASVARNEGIPTWIYPCRREAARPRWHVTTKPPS